jgi:predicted nucleic acid-binding protein
LTGRQVVVSFQTAAELLAGAIFDGWAERRMAHLRGILENTPTIVVDTAVIERCAALTASCRRDGHPLHQKHHTADRWVAACAIAKDLALLAGDGIYRGVPGLTLLA